MSKRLSSPPPQTPDLPSSKKQKTDGAQLAGPNASATPRLLSDPRFIMARKLLTSSAVDDCERGVGVLEGLLSSMVDVDKDGVADNEASTSIEERIEAAAGFYEYGRGLYRSVVVRGYEIEDKGDNDRNENRNGNSSNNGNSNSNSNGNSNSNSNGNSNSNSNSSSSTTNDTTKKGTERTDEEDIGIAREVRNRNYLDAVLFLDDAHRHQPVFLRKIFVMFLIIFLPNPPPTTHAHADDPPRVVTPG